MSGASGRFTAISASQASRRFSSVERSMNGNLTRLLEFINVVAGEKNDCVRGIDTLHRLAQPMCLGIG